MTHLKSFSFLLILYCALGYSLPANAAYSVEIIIFEPTNTASWLEENWPLLPELLDTNENDMKLGNNSSSHTQLSNAQLRLNETARRLTSSGEFRILAHTAWTQPTETREGAKNTLLPDGISANGLPLQAKIKLYKQKFEHVNLEIQCERKIPEGIKADLAKKQNLTPSDLGNSWRFRLQESRKIQLDELQYFDHPMFGVIMMVHALGNS